MITSALLSSIAARVMGNRWWHFRLAHIGYFDGRSFPVQRVMHSRGGTHLGLLGMRERLEMVGGSFRVTSARGKGTTIHAEIPLDESSPGDGEDKAP